MSEKNQRKFCEALSRIGLDPSEFKGQSLSLDKASFIFELDQEQILKGINSGWIHAHYSYHEDQIVIDALDTAHYRFCIQPAL